MYGSKLEGIKFKATQEYTIFARKREELLEMAKSVIPEEAKVSDIKYVDEKIYARDFAKLQRKLDIYAYTHRSQIEELRKHIDEIAQERKKDQKKERLLKSINDIQTKFKVFGRYIQDEDLEQLYRAKFAILTSDINAQKESPLNGIDNKIELEYYKKIIDRKMQAVFQGTNHVFIQMFPEGKLNEAVNIVKEILKNGKRTFDLDKIAKDRQLLSLVLAFDSGDGLSYLKFEKEKFDVDFHEDVCEWEERVSLKTIAELKMIENRGKVDENEKNPYLKLHNIFWGHMMADLLAREEFKLPDEIIKLKSIDGWTDESRYRSHFTYKLRNSVSIILPPKLKSIGKGVFKGCSDLDIVLFNEGLEDIDDEAFEECRILGTPKGWLDFRGSCSDFFDELCLPSTLKRIGNKAFYDCYNLHIKLNEGLEEIGDKAFGFSSFEDFIEFSYDYQGIIQIPSSVKCIGKNVVNPDITILEIIEKDEMER